MKPTEEAASNTPAPATVETPDLDPRSVRFHLHETRDEDPAARVERLTDLLEKIRGGALSARARLASIEYCGREATRLRRSLDRSLAGLSLPLPRDKDRISRKHARIHRLLAECYRDVAIELPAVHSRGAKEAACLARSCYSGLASLGEYLVINYGRYSKVTPGVWLDVHRLYHLALGEGVHDMPLDQHSRPPRTVEHMYKRLLLLGLSDPFHHPFRGLGAVYEKLDQWAALVSLTTTSVDSSRCLFTVDPALDRPAMPALSRSRIRPQFNEKWLNTRRLVDHLKQQHHDTAKTAVKQLDQPENITEELESIEQLRRMIVHWGIHPIRNASRRPTYQCCDMVIGLKSVCITLNGFAPLTINRAGPRTAVVNMVKGKFDKDQSQAVDNIQISTQWEIVDESERGFKVVADTSDGCASVSVGELVAIRTEKTAGWIIGSVHWAQTDDHNTLSLGIKRIRLSARPAAVFRLQTDRTLDHTRCSALLLEDESGDGRNPSLICDKCLYFPTATYLVRYEQGHSERVVEALNVLLTTRSFVWFEVGKPRADTTQRTLDLILPR